MIMDTTDIQNLAPIIQQLNAMEAQFAGLGTGFQIMSLVLIKDASSGSVAFTWNPDTKTYDVTITQ